MDKGIRLQKELANPATHKEAAKEAGGTYPDTKKQVLKKGGKVKCSKCGKVKCACGGSMKK